MAEEKRFCSSCGAPLAPGAKFCTSCGAQQTEANPAVRGQTPKKKKSVWLPIVIILAVAAVAATALVLILGGGEGGGSSRDSGSRERRTSSHAKPFGDAESGGSNAAKPAGDSAPAKPALIKVGIIHLDPSESGYREANVRDLTGTFTRENGYDATFVTASTSYKQTEAARAFITAGVDYLLICPAETTGWDAVLKEARDAGIKVLLFERVIDCDPSLYAAAVVSDMHREGENAVAWLESLNLPEYKILHIQGQLGSDAQIGRSEPLIEKCETDRHWTLVRQGTGGDSWDPNEAKKIAQSAIYSGEDFNIVYAENDGMAAGVVQALDAAAITHGVDGDVIVVSFDCNKWALEELLAGNWNYDGQCSPFYAATLDRLIKTLDAGGYIEGLDARNLFILDEKGFDARTITQADVDAYGLG